MSGAETKITTLNKHLIEEFETTLTLDRSLSKNTISAYSSDIHRLLLFYKNQETICHREQSSDFGVTHDYTKAQPIKQNIDKINKLYDAGNTIVYWTARGSRKQIDWYELTAKQLKEWGAKYNELRTDKPFYDLFVEDKSIKIEDLLV